MSPLEYQQYDCDQIGAELRRVSRRTSELFGQLDDERSSDEAEMAIGLILFWPALFFLEGGDGAQAAEYGRLRGEVDALEQVAIMKKCDMAVFDEMREQRRKAIEAMDEKEKDQGYDPMKSN